MAKMYHTGLCTSRQKGDFCPISSSTEFQVYLSWNAILRICLSHLHHEWLKSKV